LPRGKINQQSDERDARQNHDHAHLSFLIRHSFLAYQL
jgi:hypothetical protein